MHGSRITVASTGRKDRVPRLFSRAGGTLALLGLAILVLAPAAGADTGAGPGRGTIVVRAQDKQGGPLPGVVIEVKSASGESVATPITTNQEGAATLIVPAGSGYTVQARLAGYAEKTSEAFDLGEGRRTTIVFTLEGMIVEKVRVRADKLVDLDEGGKNTVTFSSAFVDDLPILGRSYQNVLKLAPGVNDSNGDGNPNVHGSRERDFKATVDGVSNVDPLTGTFMSNINPDAIEEIEVVTTGAGAEYGGAVGGFGKIITKQGSNTFDGNVSVYVRSSLFDGSTINPEGESEPVVYHDVRPTANFTGPLVKDKLFFALFHEYLDRGVPVNFVGSGSLVVTTSGTRNLDKVTWQVSPRNKMVFQAQSDPLRIEPLGVDALTNPESGYAYEQGGPIYQIHWDTQVSAVFNIQSLIGYSNTGISAIPTSNGVKNNCGIDEEYAIGRRVDPFGGQVAQPIDEDQCFESLTSRTSGSYVERYSDQRIRYTIRSDGNYFLDNFLGMSHTLKAGILMQKTRFSAFDQYRGFSLFSEVESGFGGLDSVVYPGGGFLSRQVFSPGYPDAELNSAEGMNYGVYIEDQFRPSPDLSIRIGMRVDQESMTADGFGHFDPAGEFRTFKENYKACLAGGQNEDRCARGNFHYFHKYERFPVIGTFAFRPILEDQTIGLQPRDPERFTISNTNPAPRFSISWDPTSQGRMKLFGTAGRYYGETFLLVPLYEQPPDSFTFGYRVVADESTTSCRPNPRGDGPPICITRAEIGEDANAVTSPASIRQVDRNLKTPYQDEYTLGFSAEIFQETSITLTAIKRSYRNQFQDIDVNHIGRDLGTVATYGCTRGPGGSLVPADPTRDGKFDDCGGQIRVVRGPPPFNRPTVIQVPDGIPDLYVRNPFFNQINLVGNFNQSDYKAYQVELVRRLHRNWELEASYVWSKATGQAEDYNQTLGNDPTTIQDEYGYLSYDQRNVLKINARTQIPSWNLRLSTAVTWQSGLPYSIVEVRSSYDAVEFFGNSSIQYLSQRTTYPTHERNDQRNAGYWQVDVGGRKDFSFGSTSLDVSLDVINLLNNDTVEIVRIANGNAIAVRPTGRQFQIGLRFAF